MNNEFIVLRLSRLICNKDYRQELYSLHVASADEDVESTSS
jgi:hypothetical protein